MSRETVSEGRKGPTAAILDVISSGKLRRSVAAKKPRGFNGVVIGQEDVAIERYLCFRSKQIAEFDLPLYSSQSPHWTPCFNSSIIPNANTMHPKYQSHTSAHSAIRATTPPTHERRPKYPTIGALPTLQCLPISGDTQRKAEKSARIDRSHGRNSVGKKRATHATSAVLGRPLLIGAAAYCGCPQTLRSTLANRNFPFDNAAETSVHPVLAYFSGARPGFRPYCSGELPSESLRERPTQGSLQASSWAALLTT